MVSIEDEVLCYASRAIDVYYKELYQLKKLPIYLLRFLPEAVLIHSPPLDIDCVWDVLPPHLTSSVAIQSLRRCQEHYKTRGIAGFDDWDGPNPRVKDCCSCQSTASH